MKYKRVLLKLSGEQFGGSSGSGIDSNFINDLANELKELVDETGVELAVVMGGGNFVRGKDMKIDGLKEETAHYMGIVSIIINGLALKDVLETRGLKTHLQSGLPIQNLVGPINKNEARANMRDGKILIVVGGIGKPFVTSDTAALSTAVQLKCDVVLKATKVDGIYNKDPMKYPDAKKIKHMSYKEAYDSPEVAVMDKTAIGLARDNSLPIIVFGLSPRGNIKKAVQGQPVGSKVSNL